MKEPLWHRLLKNSYVSAIKDHEHRNNPNKIIYLIGHPIAFVRININTGRSGVLLFHLIIGTLKFFIKNNSVRKINSRTKYDTTAQESLETS